MAQTNPVQNQPSMDDILASIRRIIDDGNKKPDASAVAKDAVANDDATPEVSKVSQIDAVPVADALSAEVYDHAEAPAEDAFEDIGVPELDSFLESLDAKYETAETNVVSLDAVKDSVSIIDPVKPDFQQSAPQQKTYEHRFTHDDRTAFEKVGSALTAKTTQAQQPNYEARPSAPSQMPQAKRNLVSDQVRSSIGNSFESLSEALAKEAGRDLPGMTEDLLKPMLSDWLDNNLPAMVERLVRAEIERIARGE